MTTEHNVEELLPESVLAKAVLRDREYAWALDDVEEAITAAKAARLVCVGGQPQFRFPGGICELYWLNADAGDRSEDETWSDYVDRAAEEVLAAFRRIRTSTDLVEEGKREFGFVREQAEQGADLAAHLCFVLYFDKECPPAAKGDV